VKYLLYLLLLLCFGCKKDDNPKVEIYLLKYMVSSFEGQAVVDTDIYKALPDSVKKRPDLVALEQSRYSAIDTQFIYGGDYNVKLSDLKMVPFITDDEILSFNLDNNKLSVDSLAANRIYELKRNMIKGVQFVITVDKKPVLNGYFWSLDSSYSCNSYCIYYISTKYINEFRNERFLDKSKAKERYFEIFYNHNSRLSVKKKRPPYPPKLLEALRQTNRLIE
jgi:hypothetical protein